MCLAGQQLVLVFLSPALTYLWFSGGWYPWVADQTLISGQAGIEVVPALVTFLAAAWDLTPPPSCAKSRAWMLRRRGFHTKFLLFLQLDVAIDGADEVDSDLNLIKGGG